MKKFVYEEVKCYLHFNRTAAHTAAMVQLTMTPLIVDALNLVGNAMPAAAEEPTTKSTHIDVEDPRDAAVLLTDPACSEEASLLNPTIGNPISHSQILALHESLKKHSFAPTSLDGLLRNTTIYTPPPPPAAPKSASYIALMARLRAAEEARLYNAMTAPPEASSLSNATSNHDPFTNASYQTHQIHVPNSLEDDEVTYADISRQMTLILNVLVSIFACGAAVWMMARHWQTPARLAVAMAGGLLVGVAEVVVYSGYLRRIGEAKRESGKLKEVKEIVGRWEVGGGKDKVEEDMHTSLGAVVAVLDTGTGNALELADGKDVRKRKSGEGRI